MAAGAAVAAGPAAAKPNSGRVGFLHSVASGDPQPNAVILWTRITPDPAATPGSGRGPAATVRWEVATDPEMRSVVSSGTARTDVDRDHTVKVDVTGLAPDTRYYYRFTAVDGAAAGRHSPVGATKTAPALGADVDRLSIAVCSCANYEAGFFRGYRAMADNHDLDLVVHLGDYTYEYAPGDYPGLYSTTVRTTAPPRDTVTLNDYRIRLGRYRTDPDLVRLHERVPFLCMWDDHESADNSWRNGAENHRPEQGSWRARKAASEQAYFEWMPVRPNSQQGGQHLYRKLQFGNLAEVIVPDLRSYRDEAPGLLPLGEIDDPRRSMTGAAQYSWLESSIVSSPTRWQVVGTSVLMAPLVIPTGLDPALAQWLTDNVAVPYDGVPVNTDQWDGYPAERRKLLSAIDESGKKGVVFVAGDIHSSWAADLPLSVPHYGKGPRGRVVACEFTPGSITAASPYDTIAVSRVLAGPTASAIAAGEAAIRAGDQWIKEVDLTRHGYGVLEVTRERARMQWYFVDDVLQPNSPVRKGFAWHTRYGSPGLRRG